MKIIIGLGNPGKKFEKNRHNVGHMFVDFLDSQEDLLRRRFLKTDCFMNESGKYVKWAMGDGRWAINGLYIVHDDLDLPLGKWKIQFGVGPKVHNGVGSVERVLGRTDFWRIRIGVDNRDPQKRESGESYVLEDFNKEEQEILEGVFDAIIKDNSFPR